MRLNKLIEFSHNILGIDDALLELMHVTSICPNQIISVPFVIFDGFCHSIHFSKHQNVVVLNSILRITFLGKIALLEFILPCFFDQIREPIIFKRGQFFEDKDRIVLFSALPNKFLQLLVSEDDQVDISPKQLLEVGKIILESSFAPVLQVTAFDVVEEGDLGVYGFSAMAMHDSKKHEKKEGEHFQHEVEYQFNFKSQYLLFNNRRIFLNNQGDYAFDYF